jgi:hypothetical protein
MSEIPVQSSTYDDPDAYGEHALTDEPRFDETVESASVVDLDSDPFADDLSRELALAAPKTWFNRTTVVIGGLALIVGGFLGGVQVQKHYGSSSGSTSLANLRSQFARGATGRGGEGGGGFLGGGGFPTGTPTATAAPAETGTIKLVDGTTIYVTLADGTILTVKTTDATKVTTSSSTKVGTLKAGDTVTIAGGTPDSTGNMTATSVTKTK